MNVAALERILDERGWPDDEQAFTVAFEATALPALMRRVRTLLMLGPRYEIDRRRAAMIDDRIRVLEGRAQWYGTADGPIASPEGLALRRRAMAVTDVLPRATPPFDASLWRQSAEFVPAPTLILAESGDPVFRDAIELRYRVLRAPIGVPRSAFVPERPGERICVCALHDGEVVGTVAVELTGAERGRLRQMAVAPSVQGGRVGRSLLSAVEREAKRQGITAIWMHARAHVIGFYSGAGYSVVGDLIEEVGIPHVRMEKTLA